MFEGILMELLTGTFLILAGYFVSFLGGSQAAICKKQWATMLCFVGGVAGGWGLILLGCYRIAGK
jgi:hypothetical protein